MMNTVMMIEHDAHLSEQMSNLLRKAHPSVELILQASSEAQAMAFCKEKLPQLILIDADIADDERLYRSIDTLRQAAPESIVILLLNDTDIVRLRTFLRQRNERFLLKPIDPDNFNSIIASCLREIDMLSNERVIIEELKKKMQRYRPQLINMVIHDIAVNASSAQILQNLGMLGYTFTEGVIAVVPQKESAVVKDEVTALFEHYHYDVLRSDFYDHTVYLILAHPVFIFEEVKRLEKQIALLNSNTFFLGTGYVKRSVSQMHLCYKEAVEELITNRILSGHDSWISETAQKQIHQRAQIVFAYFLMMNESHVKHHLQLSAQIIFLYDSEHAAALITSFLETFAQLLSHSFQKKVDLPLEIRSRYENAQAIYMVMLNEYQQISEPYQIMRNDIPHQQLRRVLYHILNHHTDPHLTLRDVASAMHISEYYICKLFQHHTDLTFTEFLNSCRIEHAKNLLQDKMRIKEIAHEVGFQSSTYFGRVFRSYTTMTPREYRSRFIFQ